MCGQFCRRVPNLDRCGGRLNLPAFPTWAGPAMSVGQHTIDGLAQLLGNRSARILSVNP